MIYAHLEKLLQLFKINRNILTFADNIERFLYIKRFFVETFLSVEDFESINLIFSVQICKTDLEK